MSKYDCKGCIYDEEREYVPTRDFDGEYLVCEKADWVDNGECMECFKFTSEADAKETCTYCKHYNDDDCKKNCWKLDEFEEDDDL